MVFGLPSIGESSWGQKILDSINFLKSEQDGRLSNASLTASFVPKMGGRVRSAVAANSAADQSATLQGEINSLSASGGGIIDLPAGVIYAALVMKDGVSLHGCGKLVTTIKPPTGSTAAGCVTLNTGPVRGWLRHLGVRGNGNAGQRGIYFQAVGNGGTPNIGGWWNSGLDDVLVRDFLGDQIWLRGGGVDYLKPHQFLTFKDVESYTTGNAAALRITGQVAQVDFLGHCEFDGASGGTNTGTCVVITREVTDALANVSDVAPALIRLGISTIQNNVRGITCERATGVSWRGWMENLKEGVETSVSAVMDVTGASLYNVGSNAGAGFALKAASSSTLFAHRNVFSGTCDVHLLNSFGNLIQSENVNVNNSPVTTSGLTPNLAVTAAGAVDLYGNRTAIINGTATQLVTINSQASVGERVSIKAWGGSLTLNSTGNINASGLTMPYTVPANAVVTLVKYDAGGTWQVENVSTQ